LPGGRWLIDMVWMATRIDFERDMTATGGAALTFSGIFAEKFTGSIVRGRLFGDRAGTVPQAAVALVVVVEVTQPARSHLVTEARSRHGPGSLIQ
jgi:hypothetical protein